MEEVKKKGNYGFLFAVLKILAIVVGIVVVVLIALYFYVRVILGIDVFGILGIVKKLGADFDESKLLTHAIVQEDIDTAFDQFDLAGLSGIYRFEDNEYIINDDISSLPTATCDIAFKDKQLCGFLESIINSSLKLEEGVELNLNIKQLKFSNFRGLAEGAKVDVNIVFHTSIKEIKSVLNVFPLSIFAKHIPEDLYISTNFTVETSGNYGYIITPINMKVNNLSYKQTASAFNAIGKLLGKVTVYTFCEDIGNIVMDTLVGNDINSGFVKELDIVGIQGYAFELDGTDIKFVLKV